MTLILQIDTKSEEPIYRQIVTEIQRLIAEDVIVEGTVLPPVRQLAGDLGVNLNTVAIAYRKLQVLGLIQIRHGSGAIVARTTVTNDRYRDELPKRIGNLIVWAKVRGFSAGELSKSFSNTLNRLYEE